MLISTSSIRNLAVLASLAIGAALPGSAVLAKDIKASPKDVKQLCGGTYMGVNKDGEYGCINKVNVVLCKKNKCEVIKTRVAPPGKAGDDRPGGASTAGNDSGGPSGGGSGGAGGVAGTASTGNAGASSGMGGGSTIN